MSDEKVKVITEAEIPTKTFYRINENHEAVKISVEEGSLPSPIEEGHTGKYFYDNKKLYLIVKVNGSYKAKEINVENPLPDSLDGIPVGNYYYGHENFPIGVSDFSRIWGTINDSKGNPITNSKGEPIIINLQDAMNALYQMMTSRSHVWAGSDVNDVPGYAKLFIQTDTKQ